MTNLNKYILSTLLVFSILSGYAMVNNEQLYNSLKKYDSVGNITDEGAYVERDNLWGFVNTKGQEIIPCKYDSIGDFKNGVAKVYNNNKCGLVDTAGNEIVPCKFDDINNYYHGFAEIINNNKCGLVNFNGKEVIPCRYDDLIYFDKGFTALKEGNVWGFTSTSGKKITGFKYDQVEKLNDGLAKVRNNNLYGVINSKGQEVLACKYIDISKISKDFARINRNNRCGLINKIGEIIFPCMYDDIDGFDEKSFMIKDKGKWGLMNTNGEIITPCEYLDSNTLLDHKKRKAELDTLLNMDYSIISYDFTETTEKKINNNSSGPSISDYRQKHRELLSRSQKERRTDSDIVDDIYSVGWSNRSINPYGSSNIPSSKTIDVSKYAMPIKYRMITSHFGYHMHKGTDFKANNGDTVYAAFTGKVRLIEFERNRLGAFLIVRHNNGLETIYAHLSMFFVKENQYVKAGTPIALSGSTGNCTEPKLHFEIRYMGVPIDPETIFDFTNGRTHNDQYIFNRSCSEKTIKNQ